LIHFSDVALLKKQDHKAQKAFFEQYGSTFYQIAYRYARERQNAEDIVADGFIKIFEGIKHAREFNDLNHFIAWSKRIIINESLLFLRKKVNFSMMPVEDLDSTLSIEASVFSAISASEITALVAVLPAGCRTVFNLFAIEGYTHDEISKQLNISEGTSKSQLSRARALLQEKLKLINFQYERG
jgi:RNA polymerase sigma factor (sigma-70 family)